MEEILRLIVIDDSSNDAESVGSLLRNAGHAVRTQRAEDDEDLRSLLAQHSWDMVLTKAETLHLSAIDALHIVAQLESDVPLMILSESFSDAILREVLAAGARSVVSLEYPTYLVHTLVREFDDLQKRRRHRDCETLLLEANSRAQQLVDSSRDAIAYVHEGMYIYANESYLQMFGYSALEEIEGLPLMNMVSPADHGMFKEFLRSYLKGRTATGSIDVRGIKTGAKEFKMTMEFSPATYEGEPCIQIIIRDQSLSKELEEKLNSLRKRDLLTGAYNRQYFMGALQGLVGRDGTQGAVLYVAPEDFKSIQDRIGIAGGDAVIADLAGLLKKHLSDSSDILARFDSDVFTIIVPEADMDNAENIAQGMLKAIEEHIFDANGQTVSLICNIGGALYHEDIHDVQELLVRCEKAYRNASGNGKHVAIYNPLQEGMAEREQASLLIKQIKTAIRNNRMQLLFQPIVSLHGDPVENYEVLLRMLDDNGHPLMPGEFMPAAEQAGLMGGIDRWVLAHTVKAMVERLRSGKRTNFFVKLSTDSLRDEKLLPWLRDLLRAAKAQGNFLTLEMSETVTSSNLKLIKPFIEGLRQLRIRFTIDHFGLAPNFTNLLRHCDADFLKIDGSLIRGIAHNPDDQARVREITGLVKDAGKKSIAEFVEDANTLATLWSCGIDYIQGYFLQGPMAVMDYDFNAS